jgi:pyridoxal phosphate enzyme (YggS family)
MQPASDLTARLLRDNWLRVTEQVAEACLAAGRQPHSVRIVGVSKYVSPELAWQLAQAGCNLFGENRPQSLWDKVAYFGSQPKLASSTQWHLIGHLQRNKIKRTLPLISLLHSLDSLRLSEALSQEASLLGRVLPVLLEVNVTSDATKTGMAISELEELLGNVERLPGIKVSGLMAMSSLAADALAAQREFEQVRLLRDQLQTSYGQGLELNELSMGMSGDFPAAIAAGATLVRIGSSLWQGL